MNTISSQLLAFFESEIRRIETEQSRPGWSKWAIVGALGTTSWLLSVEVEKVQLSWSLLCFLLLTASIVIDFLRDCDRLLAISRNSNESPRIFHFNQFGYQLRRSCAFDFLTCVFLVFAALEISYPLLQYFKTIFVIVCGTRALGAMATFAASYSSEGIPTKLKPWIIIDLSLLALAMNSFFLASIVMAIRALPILPSVAEARIAVFIAAIYGLLKLLLDSALPHPLLGSLREVQRGYALGEIDQKTAQRQFARALNGMSVADYSVHDLVKRANKMERDLIAISDDLDRIRHLLRRKLSDDSRSLIQLLARSTTLRFEHIQQDLHKMKKATGSFPLRLKMLNAITDLTFDDVTPLLDAGQDTLKSLTKSGEAVAASIRSLQANARFQEIADAFKDT